MKTLSLKLRRIASLAILFGAAAAISAQLPIDTQVWKDRCNLLAASSSAIQTGATPAPLLAATRGVPARGFFILAVNRAQAGDHYVACTMYYLAAISERQGNGGFKSDPLAVTNDAIVGGSELKLAHHQHLRMKEHEVRIKLKVEEITGKPLVLTPPETSAVLDAAGTTPITVPSAAPPSSQEAMVPEAH